MTDEVKVKAPVNRFYKISEKQFMIDKLNDLCNYDDIQLPKRATVGSAGYDFYSILDFTLEPGTTRKIPTGIRVELANKRFLMCVPRSSLGFKFKLKLDNTVGIIDSDYAFSDNEGHIWLSLTNMSDKLLTIHKGDAIMQGIILNFDTVVDDSATNIRNGGIGSTNKIKISD